MYIYFFNQYYVINYINYVKTRYTNLALFTRFLAILPAKFELGIQLDNIRKSLKLHFVVAKFTYEPSDNYLNE